MWRQMLFWAMMGPKHLQRFLLLWLAVIGLFLYGLLQEASDGRAQRGLPPDPPAPTETSR
jgi:hypothetical protein